MALRLWRATIGNLLILHYLLSNKKQMKDKLKIA